MAQCPPAQVTAADERDRYIVEKILSHFVDDSGEVRYEIKWEGFEKKSDRTYEPEENLA